MGDYPLSFSNQRPLSSRYRGNVFIWDVDKTYLSTPFSSLSGLLRIPLEFAVDKKGNPGMAEVLRGLRRGRGTEFRCVPLYFISASPPQLRKVLEHKMMKDGVEQDGLIFKDWLKSFLQLRPDRLFEQLGFKVIALLTLRLQHPLAREFLFGDDVERDADAYELYARILEGRFTPVILEKRLAREGLPREDCEIIKNLVERLPKTHGNVERIFIHLEAKTPPEKFRIFGSRVVPVRGAFQLALSLYALKLIDAEAVRAAYRAVTSSTHDAQVDGPSLLKDARRRRLISLRASQNLKIFTG